MRSALLRAGIPYLAALLALVLWRCQDAARQREIGALTERLRYTSDSLRVTRAEGRRFDTVYARDTLRLWRTVRTTETLIDTLLRSDTVTLTRRESVLVFAADSIVRQCREAVESCEAVTGNLRTQLSLVTTQRDAYRVLVPSGYQSMTRTVRDAAIGAALCYLLCPNR